MSLVLNNQKTLKTLLHVNYYEGKGRLPGLFKLAEMNGCDGVELRGKNKYEESEEKYLSMIEELKQQYPHTPDLNPLRSLRIRFQRGFSVLFGHHGERQGAVPHGGQRPAADRGRRRPVPPLRHRG